MRVRKQRIVDPGAPRWARHPVVGEDGRLYYSVGCLAEALGLTSDRVRRWVHDESGRPGA